MDCFYSIGIAAKRPRNEHIKGSDEAELIAFSITWQFSENGDATEARISGKQIVTYA